MGSAELGGGGEILRGAPGAGEEPRPPLATGEDDGIAEAPALLVLAQLELQAEQPLEHPPGQPPLGGAAAGHRAAQTRQRGEHLGADGIHHVLGVALDEGHGDLQTLHQLPALLTEGEPHQFPVAQALREGAGLAGAGEPHEGPEGDGDLEALDQLAEDPREVTRAATGSPENWTAWVISWIVTHVSSCSLSTCMLWAAAARLGATSSRRGVTVGSSRARSYWPSTRWERRPAIAPTCAPSSRPPAAPRAS